MSSRALRVLVVDDEGTIRMNLVEFLGYRNFDVRAASSAEQALVIVAGEPIDVCIVDIRLPSMDGNAFILEAHRLNPAMRFLIITGSTGYRIPDAIEAIGVGLEHLFKKPLTDMNLLVRAMEGVSTV